MRDAVRTITSMFWPSWGASSRSVVPALRALYEIHALNLPKRLATSSHTGVEMAAARNSNVMLSPEVGSAHKVSSVDSPQAGKEPCMRGVPPE